MKFNKSRQLLLVSAASLLAASLITACETLTVDFVYVASSRAAGPYNDGEINVFEINSESGFMRQIPTSPFPSGGRDPIAEVVSPDYLNLYVVNQFDNSIVQFAIGNDGKLYPQNTVNTPGIYPLAAAVNGSNMFVLDTYQPLPICSTASPCSGSIAVFPIEAASGSAPSGALGPPVANGTLNYWPLTLPGKPNHVIVPTSVNVLTSGKYVYVTAFDCTAGATCNNLTPTNLNTCALSVNSSAGGTGYVFGFSVASSGALTPLNGGTPIAAGSHPCAIASDSTSSFVYVADYASGKVLAYSVASGLLTPLTSGANGTNQFAAGNQPSAIVADPSSSFPYVYVANSTDDTVTAYEISYGTLSCNSLTIPAGAICNLGTFATGLNPVAIGIDPSKNHFVYTANFLGNDISGFEVVTTGSSAGALINSEGTPYTSNAQPTSVAAIPHNGSN